MRGSPLTIALAAATALAGLSGCFLPTSRRPEAPQIAAGHPYWLGDNVPDGTPIDDAIRTLESAGLVCVVGEESLLVYASEDRIVGEDGPQSMYVLQIRDGRVYQRHDPPQTKRYRTHGGII